MHLWFNQNVMQKLNVFCLDLWQVAFDGFRSKETANSLTAALPHTRFYHRESETGESEDAKSTNPYFPRPCEGHQLRWNCETKAGHRLQRRIYPKGPSWLLDLK